MKCNVRKFTLAFVAAFFLCLFSVASSYCQAQNLTPDILRTGVSADYNNHISDTFVSILSNDLLCTSTSDSLFQNINSFITYWNAHSLFTYLILHMLFLILSIGRRRFSSILAPPSLLKLLNILYKRDGKKEKPLLLTA